MDQVVALLLECRAVALRRLGRTNEEVACIESYVAQYAKQSEVLSVAAQLYGQIGQFGQELKLLDELLKRDPNRLELLYRKGLAQLDLAQYEAATLNLTAALSIAPRTRMPDFAAPSPIWGSASLRLHVQITRNCSGLLRIRGTPVRTWHCCLASEETNLAIRYYEQYLSNRVSETHQDTLAVERLTQLRAAKSK